MVLKNYMLVENLVSNFTIFINFNNNKFHFYFLYLNIFSNLLCYFNKYININIFLM